MLNHLDTIASAVRLERDLALKEAERRAVVINATKETRSTQTVVRIDPATSPRGGMVRAIQSLRWVLQPSRA